MIAQKSIYKRQGRLCNGAIKCKPTKEGEIRRQHNGRSESLYLNFKQLDQGCICGEIHFMFLITSHGRGFMHSQAMLFSVIIFRKKV